MVTIPEHLRAGVSDGTPERIIERYAGLVEAAHQADYGKYSNNVVVVDTETTGVSFEKDELIQIAAARIEGGRVVDTFETFVNPGVFIPEEIQLLTRIGNQEVVGAPSPEEAVTSFVAFAGDAVLVAHNATFDRTFLTRHKEGYPLLDNEWIDTLLLSRIALPRAKSHRLKDFVDMFDLPKSSHRADDDVAATCALLGVLLAGLDAMPIEVLREASELDSEFYWPMAKLLKYFVERRAAEASATPEFSLRAVRSKRIEALTGAKGQLAGNTPQQESINEFDGEDEGEEDTAQSTASAAAQSTAAAASAAAGTSPSSSALEISFPTAEEVADAFSAQGMVGRLYPDYEMRESQRSMALAVRAAFEAGDNLIAEAGTGVGKSMAYLVPAALMAKEMHTRVGVATKTNALLDQLMYHELPALAQGIPGLTYCAIKGFSNYVCLRKAAHMLHEKGKIVENQNGMQESSAGSLACLLSYLEQTDYDDTSSLKIDYRQLPSFTITTNSQECFRRKCPYYGKMCMVHGARAKAAKADIVVTNHSMLFCDLNVDGGLLPETDYWIIDEAHNAEEEARTAFSLKLDSAEVLRVATQLSSPSPTVNAIRHAQRTIAGKTEEPTFGELFDKALALGTAFAQAADNYTKKLKDLLYFREEGSRDYELSDLWINDQMRVSEHFKGVCGYALLLKNASEEVAQALSNLVGYLEDEGATEAQRELSSCVLRLKEIIQAIDAVFLQPSPTYAYSATLSKKKDRYVDVVAALMLNVGDELHDRLWSKTQSVILTSATMTVSDRFDSFANSLGLDMRTSACDDGNHARGQSFESSYDFDHNMTIYVPTDMPEPYSPGYQRDMARLLTGAHLALGGSMLTLFTNRKEMEGLYEDVKEALRPSGLRVVCQKKSISNKALRDDFIADHELSLFALKTFWEGFDAPGDTLRGVIITKLPFNKPNDPLGKEREIHSRSAFMEFTLPKSVIEVKQAAGRLIRKASDRGILILADKRILTKTYGTVFMNSLPSRNIKTLTIDEIIRDIEENYHVE